MTDWCPGATRSPQPGGVTLDRSLPARAVWHITWDALRPDGGQPAFSAVSGYLKRVGYCPHIMWNPFTGEIEQFYPASVGGRALKYNNQDGEVCVQIEVHFTPGCVVDGRRYMTVADTPCKGLDVLLQWLDGLGVPRVWPMGAPAWSGNSRDVDTWNRNAGHYGHCHSPGDDHTDPGPMPSLDRGIAAQGSVKPATPTIDPEEDEDMLYITQGKGDPVIWIGNMIQRRPIADEAELKTLRQYAKDGVIKIFRNGDTQTWPSAYIGKAV